MRVGRNTLPVFLHGRQNRAGPSGRDLPLVTVFFLFLFFQFFLHLLPLGIFTLPPAKRCHTRRKSSLFSFYLSAGPHSLPLFLSTFTSFFLVHILSARLPKPKQKHSKAKPFLFPSPASNTQRPNRLAQLGFIKLAPHRSKGLISGRFSIFHLGNFGRTLHHCNPTIPARSPPGCSQEVPNGCQPGTV